MKILLLEDELMLNNAISEYLKNIGHMVESFCDGQEVLNTINNSYDLLVLDINVPTKDGFEILTELNRQKIYIPTIFISALIDIEDISKKFYDSELDKVIVTTLLSFIIILFLVYLIKSAKNDVEVEEVDDSLSVVSNFKIGLWLLIGALSLYFGSEWLVRGSKEIATSMGVSEAVIGVSLIAIGTSVPELAASVIAAAKQEKAISLGNLIGSNIFNIGSVLGLTALVKPIPVTEAEILTNDIFWMLGFAAILVPLILLPKRLQISRWKGFLLVLAYGAFMFLLFTKGKF